MSILVIYDSEGYILGADTTQREPVGVPFMWVDVPTGKYLAKIDVSGDTHMPVFQDIIIPKSPEQLRIEELENQVLLLADSQEGGIL